MKKTLQNASTGSDKHYSRLLFLFLFFTLGINLSGQKIQTMLIENYPSGNFVNFALSTYTYDGSGYLTNTLYQEWDAISSSFKDKSRIVYSNNSDGTPSIMTNQTWNGSAWVDGSRTTYTYYSNGTENVATTQTWNGSAWNDLTRTTNTYNASKQVLTSITESFAGIWMNS